MPVNEFDPPERFVAGTVGPPGQRTFFLQARQGRRVTSISLEKVQVSVLSERIDDLLAAIADPSIPSLVPVVEDNAPLDTPIEDDFRINTLSLAWDQERAVVVIECHDRDPDAETEAGEVQQADDGSLPAEIRTVRVVLGPDSARAFARRCAALVTAGRPPCPFCGGPLDPEGHICPRSNGYKR